MPNRIRERYLNKHLIVELRGFEPLTLSMPWRCATSCAIAPYSIVSSLRTSYTIRRNVERRKTRRVARENDKQISLEFQRFRRYTTACRRDGRNPMCFPVEYGKHMGSLIHSAFRLHACPTPRASLSVRAPIRPCRRWRDRDCSPSDAIANRLQQCPSAAVSPNARYPWKACWRTSDPPG